MITPAEMFGAFNRLAMVMAVQEIQAAFSASDGLADAVPTSPQDAAAPTQTEIQPPFTEPPDPVLASFFATPSAPAGQTLLGLRSPQTGGAPVSLPASCSGDASAASAVLNDAGESAPPGSAAPEGAANALASGPGAPINPGGAGPGALPNAGSAPSSPGESGQTLAPEFSVSFGAAASSNVASEIAAQENAALAIALTDASQLDTEMETASVAAGSSSTSLSANVQTSEPGTTLAAGGQTAGRAAAPAANTTLRASALADGADTAPKGAPAFNDPQANRAAPAPPEGSALSQRQEAASAVGETAALVAHLGSSVGGTASLQMASASVVDTLILNAAMIPGWPLQRPFEPLAPEAIGAEQPALQGMDEEELINYLAGMGANEALNARIRKASDDPVRLRKLLRSLVILIAVVTTIIDAMRAEVEQLIADLRAGYAPGMALAPHSRRRMLPQ